MEFNENDIEQVIDFLKENSIYKDDEFLRKNLTVNLQSKTCIVLYDKTKIVGVARWNLHGDTAHILDVCINKSWRNGKALMMLLAKGHSMYPDVKYIEFERPKYSDKKSRYVIKQLLKGDKYGK